MRTLIVGCGYLGLRVARLWREAGHEIVAVTRSSVRADAFRQVGIVPLIADVMRPAALARLPAGDILLYAVGFDRAAGHGRRDVYVHGLENVLRIAASRVGRLVYVSSTSVYGQTAGEWVNEESACEPATDAGRTCLEAENVVWRYFGGDRPSANVLRLSGIYGPGRLLARIESLRAGEPIAGNPDAWLNLIQVEDAARAVVACADRGTPAATYLVSDDRPATRREYYTRLAGLSAAPPPVFSGVDTPEARTSGLNKRCDNSRLKRDLLPELLFPTFEQGLPNALSTTRIPDA